MKFNEKKTIANAIASRSDATTNFEGGIAFKVEPKMELFLRVASAMVGQPKFYTDVNTNDREIVSLIRKVGADAPEFVFKLALYTREQLYLRSVPVMMIAELLNSVNGIPTSQNWVESIIQRPDEITELLSYQFKLNETGNHPKKHIPAAMKRGIARSFEKFDAYQLSKYNAEGKAISIKDAMFLTHPTPTTAEQIELYRKIADGTLEGAGIWETSLMKAGMSKTEENASLKEDWEKILPRMGYMAILRNVRNFIKTGVDTDMYVPRLYDPEFVRRSKQLPFRFYSAWKVLAAMQDINAANVEDIPYVMKGIERALNASVMNVPVIPGLTFVAIDVSGSMDDQLSHKRGMDYRTWESLKKKNPYGVTRKDVSTLFGAIVNSRSERAIISVFGEDFKLLKMSSNDILVNQREAAGANVGHSTNAWKAIHYLNTSGKKVDRIVVFSDEVVYDSSGHQRSFIEELTKYQRNVNPDVFIYSVDLGGYGFSSIPENTKNTVKLAGFSDKIFHYISLFEKDKNTMMSDIENYQCH